MMACLFHYNLDVSLVMRFLGGNHTAAHRDVQSVASILLAHKVPLFLVQQYVRVMTVGCPSSINADVSRENALQYWRAGNNPSVKANMTSVKETMNKEDRNKFVIPLSCWSWRFIPHLFITPKHILLKNGKKRMIYDAAHQHTRESIPVNMMTENASFTELHCDFGRVKSRLYKRVYNLRGTRPNRDIVLHANDVKSCFRQLKHHPDCMGLFSFIIDDLLYLQCGLTFGSDFSPASWEVLRRIIEILAESLFNDETLRSKHRKYLDRIQWQRSLGSTRAVFTPAKLDDINRGVHNAAGNDVNTPHDMFVNDDIYADVFDVTRHCIEQAAASSIEAIFITLGESDLTSRQDAVLFGKSEDTPVAWLNRLIGVDINSRRLAVRTPVEYVATAVAILHDTWHRSRQTFIISEAEYMTGRLGYVAETSPWLRFMISFFHVSIAKALGAERVYLIANSRDFRDMLKAEKKGLKAASELRATGADSSAPSAVLPGKPSQQDAAMRYRRFAASNAAKKVHHSRTKFFITRDMRREITLVYKALTSPWINMWRPIGHLIKRRPSAVGYSDSCLHAAGGYSLDLGFWWYIECWMAEY